jgi:glycosyltransferase involved in cell wall biosynthesis
MRVTLLGKIAGRLVHLGRLLKNGIKAKIFGVGDFGKEDLTYKRWVKETALTAADIESMKKEIESFAFKPKISLIMPVYNIPRQWLVRAIESVFDQVYENWELCIADDASPKPHIREVLSRYQTSDKRVKVKFLEENQGMSGAYNTGLDLAAGQYAAFLDHDDELSRDSLFEVVKLLNLHPEAEIIYSDEDKLTMSGQRLRPVYKPDWDPGLFLTYNYLCHLVVCSRELVLKVGGFRKGFEGCQDYDLLLRLTELTDNIFHIPKILYHWRMIPGSAAARVDAKPGSFERAKKALQEAMERRGIRAAVTDGERIGTFKVEKIKNPHQEFFFDDRNESK